MQRVCSQCNTLVTGDGAFCPNCGGTLPAAVQLEKQPAADSVQFTPQSDGVQTNAMPGYSAPQPSVMPNYNGAYANNNSQFTNANVVNTTEMTLGSWVGTIIVTTWFGLISLIFCIVWGVSDSTPIAKKRYCQAMLIIQGISLVVSIIVMIIMFTSLSAAIPSIIESIEDATRTGTYYY